MNAIELLKEQHEEVDALFAKLEETDDADQKYELFEELADKLAAHSKIEETLFYPAVMAKQTREILLESAEEHLAIKRVLADMLEMDPEDEQFDAKLAVAKERVEHHAHEEEEAELFPKVKKLLSTDELDALGGEMARMFFEALEEAPHQEIPGQTGAAAPLGGPA